MKGRGIFFAVSIGLAVAVTLVRLSFGVNRESLFSVYYIVPIIFPFVAFLQERLDRWLTHGDIPWKIDGPVVVFSILRAANIPPLLFSGHTLFLIYSLGTASRRLTKLLSAAVLVQVVHAKLFLVHDPYTLSAGIALGLLSAWIVHQRAKCSSV